MIQNDLYCLFLICKVLKYRLGHSIVKRDTQHDVLTQAARNRIPAAYSLLQNSGHVFTFPLASPSVAAPMICCLSFQDTELQSDGTITDEEYSSEATASSNSNDPESYLSSHSSFANVSMADGQPLPSETVNQVSSESYAKHILGFQFNEILATRVKTDRLLIHLHVVHMDVAGDNLSFSV